MPKRKAAKKPRKTKEDAFPEALFLKLLKEGAALRAKAKKKLARMLTLYEGDLSLRLE